MGFITNILIDFFRGISAFVGQVAKILIYLIDLVFLQGSKGTSSGSAIFWSPNTYYLKWQMFPGIYDKIIDFFKYVGISSAGLLFAISFFLMWRSDGNVKDSAFSAIRKAFTAVIVCAISVQILNFVDSTIYTVEQKFWDLESGTNANGESFWATTKDDSYMSSIQKSMSAEENNSDLDFSDGNGLESILLLMGFNAAGMALAPIGGAVIAVLAIVYLLIDAFFMVMICYYYVKLAIELIRRYVSWCILHITFPAICGTLASGYTSGIFWTYLKSYASEGICMFMTYFFMKGTSALLNNLGVGLISTFVIIAWINIGIELDKFMKDHGFSISAAGGNLAEGMVSSIARMSLVGNAISGSTGSALINAGSALGAVPLAQIGNALAHGDMSLSAAMGAMQHSATGQVIQNSGLFSDKGLSKAASGSEIAALTSLWGSGNKRDLDAFSEKFNTLSASDRGKVLDSVKDQLLNNGAGKLNDSANSFAKTFGADFANNMKLIGPDGRGNMIGEIEGQLGTKRFSIGPNASDTKSRYFESAEGKDNYLNWGATENTVPVGGNGIALSEILGQEGDFNISDLKSSELDWNSKIDVDDFNEFSKALESKLEYTVDSEGNEYDLGNAANWMYNINNEGKTVMQYNGNSTIEYSTDGKNAEYSCNGYKGKTLKNLFEDMEKGQPSN